MLKVYTSPMCGPCHVLKNRIRSASEAGQELPEHEIVDITKVDKATLPAGVRTIPTIIDEETGDVFTGIQATSERMGVK